MFVFGYKKKSGIYTEMGSDIRLLGRQIQNRQTRSEKVICWRYLGQNRWNGLLATGSLRTWTFV